MDAGQLTAAIVDVESVSGNEAALADLVEAALGHYPRIAVERVGNVVLARTDLGRPQRVALAGHLDTVPLADNLPSSIDGGLLRGCGTSDMKSGVAVALRIAHRVGSGDLDPGVDLTWVFYDCEEVEAKRNGLGRLARERPQTLQADLAVLLEPTSGLIEGGCQGTLRAVVRTSGRRAHSARSWLGENAIHALAPALVRLVRYEARVADVDGLTYREGLNAVFITGGVAANIVPDEASLTINYRFAPDRSEQHAADHITEVFEGFAVDVVDSAPGARPGLDGPLARAIAAAVGGEPSAKLGWTDVARFGELGIPAVNFGPGDPTLAHTREEHVELARVIAAEDALARFIAAPVASVQA
ncbi:MAG: succinyl-diaminopimelate desuccinylase [Actinomycetota bacterium]